jgi:predicted transcriptional regulator
LLETVSQRPGASIRELADALGIRRTAVVHHLRILSAASRIRTVRSGRTVLVFPAASTPFEGLVGLLRLRTVQNLLAAIQANPEQSVRGLGRALGITPRAVRYHLLRLRDLRLVDLNWGLGSRRIVLLQPGAIDAGRLGDSGQTPKIAQPPLMRQ